MATTVQESIQKIRESFRVVKSTAESAAVKFKDEGKPFFEAKKKLSSEGELRKSVSSACSFFSDVAERYSDESAIDDLITDPKTERDKALRDYYFFKLAKYTKLDESTLDVLENKPKMFSRVSNNPDEVAIVTVNDYVRLITSEPYKAYKEYDQVMANAPKKPDDYSLTREQKKEKIVKKISNGPLAEPLKRLEKSKQSGYRKANTISFLSPMEGAAWGFGIGGVIGIILTVLMCVAVVIALIINKVSLATFVTDELPKVGGIILSVLLLVVAGVIHGVISYYVCMFLFAIICFIAVLLIDVLIAVIWPFSAIVCGIINSRREKNYSKDYSAQKEKLQKEFNAKLAEQVKRELDEWERCNMEYQVAQNKYVATSNAVSITKKQAAENYHKEVARIAATSKPIIKSTYMDLQTIKKHVEIIRKERTKIYINLNIKYDYEEAKKCCELLDEGYVSTYDQAIEMVKNMKKADSMREQARIEQERKEREAAQKQWEQERLKRERAEQYERERKEQERIKKEKMEEERREEERIKRIENAIYEAKMAQREQTNAILRAALAEIKTMNNQNDLIEENNKLLEDLKRDLS